jgi:hypothetical protein
MVKPGSQSGKDSEENRFTDAEKLKNSVKDPQSLKV